MVVFDRLEIMPGGEKLLLEAHVSSEGYFDNVGIEGVYINTDNGFLESGLNTDAIVFMQEFTTVEAERLAVYKDEKTLAGYVISPVLYRSDTAQTYYKRITIDTFDNKRYKITGFGKDDNDNDVIRFADTDYPESKRFFVLAGDIDVSELDAVDGFVIPVAAKPAYPKSISLAIDKNLLLAGDDASLKDFSGNVFFVYVKTNGAPASDTPCGLDNEYTLGVTIDGTLAYQKALAYVRELGGDCRIPKGFIDYILLFEAFRACVETEHYTEAVKHFRKMFRTGAASAQTKGCGCRR